MRLTETLCVLTVTLVQIVDSWCSLTLNLSLIHCTGGREALQPAHCGSWCFPDRTGKTYRLKGHAGLPATDMQSRIN